MSKSKAKILSLPITNHANYNAETERQENVIGVRIDEARRKAGLSLVDFSALLRQYGITMSPSGINKWAKGSALPNAYQLVSVMRLIWMWMFLIFAAVIHRHSMMQAWQKSGSTRMT